MNHSSFLDVFIFPLIPKGRYTGLTAARNFKIPVFSTLIRRIQAIPIERKNLKAAIESIKKAEQVLKQNIHIGILPEGTRTLNGKIGPLKKGGFHMAINTATPIIPVGVSGAFSVKPKNRWWFRPGRITINIGDAINPKAYNNLGIDGLINKVEYALKILSGDKYEAK
jgi:1-acyl-sn-glycerol-3-phosphate acyltransferase